MENVNAIINQKAAVIDCNFEEVEIGISERLKEFEGAVFTENSKAHAKKTVAGLRAEQKNLKDNLRSAQKKYMEPWNAFKDKADNLISLYDQPIKFINNQVTLFEQKRIDEKRKLIQGIYEEIVDDVKDIIPIQKIYNQKWENATVKEKEIREQMIAISDSVRQAIDAIKEMDSEIEEHAISVYKKDLNLSDAIFEINRYEKQKQEILIREAEKRKKEDEERTRKEERDRIMDQQRFEEEKQKAIQMAEKQKQEAVLQAKKEAEKEIIESMIPDAVGESIKITYIIDLTEDAKEKLEIYMDSVGIEYEEIRGF